MKFAALGLVEVVGRPIVMLYPIYLLLLQTIDIVKALEHKKNVSPQSIMSVLKAVLLLYLSSYLMTLLSMYQGNQYFSYLITVIFFFYCYFFRYGIHKPCDWTYSSLCVFL